MISSVLAAVIRPDLAEKFETHSVAQTKTLGVAHGGALIRTKKFQETGFLRIGLHGSQGVGKSPYAKGVVFAARPHYFIEEGQNNQILTNCANGFFRRYDMKMHEEKRSRLNASERSLRFRDRYPFGIDLIEHAEHSVHKQYDSVVLIRHGRDSSRDRNIGLFLSDEMKADPAIQDFLTRLRARYGVNEFFQDIGESALTFEK